MRYLPHTQEDIAEMLQVVGQHHLDDLFSSIPDDCRFTGELNLPNLTEWELWQHLSDLAANTAGLPEYQVYVGAGSYRHYIPAAIPYLINRSEISTAYTPYQPEISQGTLQAIYEYQTLTARLLGMEIANASMYDGASALAEALLMAVRISKGQKTKIALSGLIHPHYRQVVKTYFSPTGYQLLELPMLPDGTTDLSGLAQEKDLAAIAVQSPNFFGCIENLAAISTQAHALGALSVVAFTEPLAYGLYQNPGSQGADIVCGEGQSLGIPQSFGGPGLGMFASLNRYVRNMPGRLIGKTTDQDGKRGFVLTLATREQHIRRERATSNICSNQGLCATMSAMYMATIGAVGVRRLAQLNFDKAEYLKQTLKQAGFHLPFARPTFNEFVVAAPAPFAEHYQTLLRRKIVFGIPLAQYYPTLDRHYLLCVTETASKADLDALAKEVISCVKH